MADFIDGIGDCDYGVAFVFDYAITSDFDRGFCTTGIMARFKKAVDSGLDIWGGNYNLFKHFFVTSLAKTVVTDNTGKVIESEFTQSKKISQSILQSELLIINPRIIITLGARSFKYFTGLTLTKYLNRAVRPDPKFGFDNVWILPVESVFTIMSERSAIINFINKLDFAIKIACGDIENPEDEFALTPFKLIDNLTDFDNLIDMVIESGVFCFDYETNAKEWFEPDARATILSVAFNPGFAYVIPIEHNDTPFSVSDISYIFSTLQNKIFNNPNVEKIAHNLKYELHYSSKYGINTWSGIMHDTMLMSHILDENTPNGLKDLQRVYFPEYNGYALVFGAGEDWGNVSLDRLVKYGAADADLTLRLKLYFENKLLHDDDESRLYVLYRNLVMFVFPTLFRMEHRGSLIDSEFIKDATAKAEQIIADKLRKLHEYPEVIYFEECERNRLIDAEINRLTDLINKHNESGFNRFKQIMKYDDAIERLRSGEDNIYDGINFGSVPQLRDLLFGDDGFGFEPNVDKYSGETKFDTSQDFLMSIDHPFITDLLAYRSMLKMVSTYYNGIIEKLDQNSYVHTVFNLHGTVTGRLSSKNPNLQNIPWFTKLVDEDVKWAIANVKRFFIAEPGMYLVQADFSQAELRIIANFSGDDTMQQAYLDKKDIHSVTACQIYGYEYDAFKKLAETDPVRYKDERATAKSANFGLVYDISDRGYVAYIKTATGKDITEKTAQLHRRGLFGAYPKLAVWHETYRQKAIKFGYVRTLFGRKRRLPDAQNGNGEFYSKALRNAINAPIQGTGGEYTLFSLALLDRLSCGLFVPRNTVHDSMIGDVNPNHYEYVCKLINWCASNPPIMDFFYIEPDRVRVPMVVDIEKSGENWYMIGKN